MSEEKQDKAISKKKLSPIVIVLVIVALVVIGNMIFGGNSAKKAGQVIHDVADDATEKATILDLGDDDREAQFQVLNTKIKLESERNERLTSEVEMLNNRFAKQENILKSLSDQLNKTSNEMRKLGEDVVNKNAEQIDSIYAGLNTEQPGSVPLNLDDSGNDGLYGELEEFDGIEGELANNTPAQLSEPEKPKTSIYGEGYVILNPDLAQTQGTDNSSQSNNVFDMNDFDGDLLDGAKASINRIGNRVEGLSSNNESRSSRPQGNSTPRNDPISTYQQARGNPAETLEKVKVPAFSFVEVTTLHGIRCPIGGSLANQPSDVAGRPVILPVRGVFKGPNGVTRDIGTAHLWAVCSARRTSDKKFGRAEFAIRQLSYWDEKGGAQTVPLSGYVIDKRDNESDVLGPIDDVTGVNLWKSSLASAMTGIASTLSQAEFTQVVGSEGNSQSFMTGSDAKAAGAQGISSFFLSLAERWKAQADAQVDVVSIPPGVPLKFVLDTEFEVVRGKNDADPDYKNPMFEVMI